MHNVLFFFLAFAGFACLIGAWITDRTWLAVGFLLFGGLMLVLYPRRAAGDPDDDSGQYAWLIPDSQPARSIVTAIVGLLCIAGAAALIAR
jgi:hypothetical protein